jgi:phosphatidate phosphatase PAH1
MDKILNFFSYNPTLVSGAMDILVIKQPNGTYKGTPLRVKFGQWSILKPKEKEVKFKINDNIINIPIKLNESGEAYIKKKNKIKIKSFDNNKSENGSSNSMSDNSGVSVDENIRSSNENSPEKYDDKIDFEDKKEKDGIITFYVSIDIEKKAKYFLFQLSTYNLGPKITIKHTEKNEYTNTTLIAIIVILIVIVIIIAIIAFLFILRNRKNKVTSSDIEKVSSFSE